MTIKEPSKIKKTLKPASDLTFWGVRKINTATAIPKRLKPITDRLRESIMNASDSINTAKYTQSLLAMNFIRTIKSAIGIILKSVAYKLPYNTPVVILYIAFGA